MLPLSCHQQFTTYSQSNETPSYVISKAGGKIGRDVAANTVAVPTDTTLQEYVRISPIEGR